MCFQYGSVAKLSRLIFAVVLVSSIGLLPTSAGSVFTDRVPGAEVWLFEDFNDGVANGFQEVQFWFCQGPQCASWSVENGEYHIYGANDMGSAPGAIVGRLDWCNYIIDVDVRLEPIDGTGTTIFAGYVPGSLVPIGPGVRPGRVGFLWSERDDFWVFYGTDFLLTGYRAFNYGQTYHVRLDTTGGMARIYIDGELIRQNPLAGQVCGTAGIHAGEAHGYFDNFQVAAGACSWWDVNCDGQLNLADVQLVASAWSNPSGYNAAYDHDSDGNIDVVDIELQVSHWAGTPD